MKILLALTLAFAAAQAINYDAEWENFKLKYEKSYDRSGEEVSHVWSILHYIDKYFLGRLISYRIISMTP